MIRLQDILESSAAVYKYPSDARFGLGAVDAYGAVHFKEFSRDIFGDQMHGREKNPWGMYRFRYLNGEIEWSNVVTVPQDVKFSAEDYLSKRGFPVTEHTSFYDAIEKPEDEGDYD